MLIEFIEYYPTSPDHLTGSLKIRLPEFKIQLLGVYAQKRNDGWFFSVPTGRGVDHKTGRFLRFPFVAFDDKDALVELIKVIREQGPAFIEKRLADTEKPLSLPDQFRQMMQPNAAIAKPSVIRSNPIAKREYVDPPPRKFSNQNKGGYVRKSR